MMTYINFYRPANILLNVKYLTCGGLENSKKEYSKRNFISTKSQFHQEKYKICRKGKEMKQMRYLKVIPKVCIQYVCRLFFHSKVSQAYYPKLALEKECLMPSQAVSFSPEWIIYIHHPESSPSENARLTKESLFHFSFFLSFLLLSIFASSFG